MFENDACYTDAQNIDEISRIVEDLSALGSYVMGFDLDFDTERQQKHIRKNDFWNQISEYWDSLYSQYYIDEWSMYEMPYLEIDLDMDNLFIIEPTFDDFVYT